ncbi:drug/metabolite transporter (DMT)-like permease [Sphaerotilus sulfidivorans]|uniref:Drug/metabolite transporter (DMT)-like permease n=2 Tax=Sphaerotilus sulfidivorans TaxID=639200 RepID=A0ABV2IRW2_9BURK|nr:DMT family transporter [Sphaerotilus sulfidivorans]
MTHSLKPSLPPNVQGILWMTLSMAAFALEDLFVKRAVQALPLSEVLVLCGLGGALVFAVLAWGQGVRLLQPVARSRLMAGRALFELVGRLFYALAIALTPLSTTTAILQATPVLVVLGGSLFFHERVGWRRWVAVGVGLLGVLIVLRPGAGDFSALSLLAVVGMIGFAGRDLASRAVPPALGTLHLGVFGFLTLALAGALYALGRPAAWTLPTAEALALLAGAVGVGTLAYAALMKAMRTGDLATVTPFRYTRLLFGLTVGALVFGERVDAAMVAGCLVIVAAGLLIAWDNALARRRLIPL